MMGRNSRLQYFIEIVSKRKRGSPSIIVPGNLMEKKMRKIEEKKKIRTVMGKNEEKMFYVCQYMSVCQVIERNQNVIINLASKIMQFSTDFSSTQFQHSKNGFHTFTSNPARLHVHFNVQLHNVWKRLKRISINF